MRLADKSACALNSKRAVSHQQPEDRKSICISVNKRDATFCGHRATFNTMMALEYLYFAPDAASREEACACLMPSRGGEAEAPY